MGKKVFIIDVERCVACYNCFIACKDEFVDHAWLPYSEAQPDHGRAFIAVNEVEQGRFPKVRIRYIPQPCMQCESPSCQKAAEDDAVYKREDGVVIIDPVKSKGQRQIAKACPFGSIIWNEKLDIPQKCTFCIHLLEQGWREPRCVEVCPTRALRYGDEEAFSDLIAIAEPFDVRSGNRPCVYYIALPKTFIAGTIYSGDGGDCMEGVKVEMIHENEAENRETTTNNYGDFEFEGIEVGTEFSLRILAEGYYPVTIENLETRQDICLDEIVLQKSV
jgi:tetrathionate reductase subunit B